MPRWLASDMVFTRKDLFELSAGNLCNFSIVICVVKADNSGSRFLREVWILARNTEDHGAVALSLDYREEMPEAVSQAHGAPHDILARKRGARDERVRLCSIRCHEAAQLRQNAGAEGIRAVYHRVCCHIATPSLHIPTPFGAVGRVMLPPQL